MFCEKCGAQLPDTVGFCNKCGNALRKNVNTAAPMMKAPNAAINQKKPASVSKKNDKESSKSLARILLPVVLIVIVAVIVIGVVKKKTSIYGTWTDANKTMTFTFNKDGRLQISGLEDTLAVDAFTFSEVDNDTLQLKAESDNPIIGAVGLNMDYEIEGDSMTVTIMGKELKLVKKN